MTSEAMRDLVRARLDAVHGLRRARQQLSGFLLRQGCHYGRPAWTKLHRRWLAGRSVHLSRQFLEKLERLKNSGAISNEEYSRPRARAVQ